MMSDAMPILVGTPSGWALGLVFLVLSILSSVLFATILRVNEARGGNRLVLLAANYIVAAASGAVYWGVTGFRPITPLTLLLGAVAGMLFVASAWFMQVAMGRVGIGISVAVMRLAVIVPIVASIAVYAEYPNWPQWGGLALAAVALYLFGVAAGALTQGAHQPIRNWLLLAAVFVTMGCINLLLKLFSEQCPRTDKPGFLTVIFSVAMAFAWTLVRTGNHAFSTREIRLGLLLGVPNFCSTIFFILALAAIPGIIVFPVNDIGVVVGSVLVGVAWWQERLDLHRRWALALGLASIVLVNLR
jgi:multidrug transporter EmrE-like cation transporter